MRQLIHHMRRLFVIKSVSHNTLLIVYYKQYKSTQDVLPQFMLYMTFHFL